jgi:Activator of Hsp90 ATPase homolog 1-like protein
MSQQTRASTRTARIIKARPEELYDAFMDPAALIEWLPPGEMTGKIHAFDARVGGGYRMSLFYPPDERSFRGKTSETEDMVDVRFVELTPPRRIVEAVTFVTTDPALSGGDDDHRDVRSGGRWNRGHVLVRELAARPATGGQRGRHAIVTGAAGAQVRVTRAISAERSGTWSCRGPAGAPDDR